MRLNALRIRSTNESSARLWRVAPGNGAAANVVCFEANPQQVEQIRAALAYVLDNQTSDSFAEVAVHMSDNAGTAWIVERTPQRGRILRNGHHIQDPDAFDILMRALLDKETDDTDLPTRIAEALEISTNNGELTLAPSRAYTGTSRVRAFVDGRSNDLVRECARVLGQPGIDEARMIADLGQHLEPLHASYKEIQRQYLELVGQHAELSKYDLRNLEKLADEVEMIEEISDVATPLLQPSASPSHLREKLTKIDADMSTALHACGLHEFTPSHQQIPWNKMVAALTKKHACQKLLAAFEQTREKLQDKIQPTFVAYLRTVESLLASDKQITAELETCLATLSLQVRQAETPTQAPEPQTKLSGILQKFLKHEPPIAPAPSKAQICARNLEDARLSVDHVLARLGELHSDVACAKEDHEKSTGNIQAVYEAIASEYGQLQAHWQQLARTYGLPDDYDINMLLKLISTYAQLTQLHQEREAIRNTVKQHRLTLAHLESLVLKWRTRTGSQKDVQMTNPALIISEAQGIIRYKSEKQEQLAKLQAIHEQLRVHHQLKTYIETRALEIRRAWNKVFHNAGLQPVPENHREWANFFKNSRAIAALGTIIADEGRPMSSDQLFTAASSESPITLFTTRATPIAGPTKLAILMRLENCTAKNLQIVIISDADLAQCMRKAGCAAAKIAENSGKQALGGNTKTANDIATTQSVISDRAHAALSVLTQRHAK